MYGMNTDTFHLVKMKTEVFQTTKEKIKQRASSLCPIPNFRDLMKHTNFPFYLWAFEQLSNCGLLGALVICEPQLGRDSMFHQMANMITFFQDSNSSNNSPVIGQERTLYHQVMTNGFQAHNGGTFHWIYLEIA